MKKFFTILSIVIAVILISVSAYAGDRMVLIERFTSATCGPCASNNPILDAFLSSHDPDVVVSISYHQNWPVAGLDPMYNYNPADNETRRSYYGVNSIPHWRFDGILEAAQPYSQASLQALFDQRRAVASPVTIIVTETPIGDSILVKAMVYVETLMPGTTANIQFAIVEKLVHYSSPPGTNGETNFYDVMRKMLPNGSGLPITLYPGQTYTIERKYKMDPIWNPSEIRPVVFIQSASKEILGAGLKTANFTLLPNPGYNVVLQGQSQNGQFKIKVPVVASGYNSPVTLTTAVDPPTSGITVTFPSGNIISNFPDSVTMQVSSLSSVPNGVYKINVTGTNSSNKTHTISVSYLVGKNYIFVGSNRSSLQFKVDNVTYSSLQFFTWDLGSSHTLSAISPQGTGSTRYVFQNWSNNGDTTQNITITPQMGNFTVNYKVQYKIVSSISPGGIPATITGGNLFYDSGSVASISISPLAVQYNNQMWYFQRWQGAGNGSYTGTNPTPQITMTNPIIETAIWDTIPTIGIRNLNSEVPKEYSLEQNYPNPFNPSTQIRFAVPKDGFINLEVYDILGNRVETIYNSFCKTGYYAAQFDASDLASGVYFYRLVAGSYTAVKKMLIIK